MIEPVERVYRYCHWVPISVGFIFGVVGLCLEVDSIRHYLTEPRAPFVTSANDPQWPIWVAMLVPAIPALVGGSVFAYTLRAKVVLDELGIVGFGLRGKATFAARWEEITAVEVSEDDGIQSVLISAGGRKLRVTSSLRGWDAFMGDVKSCAPVRPKKTW